MKNSLKCLMALLLFSYSAFPRDILYLNSGEKISGTITDIRNNLVTIQSMKGPRAFYSVQVHLIKFDLRNEYFAGILQDYSLLDV